MAPLKIIFDRRHQQRLAKAPGATEEIDAIILSYIEHHVRLVDIDKIVLP